MAGDVVEVEIHVARDTEREPHHRTALGGIGRRRQEHRLTHERLRNGADFDVILCDIGLPGMSGYDVARALRADTGRAQPEMVAVSGYALPEDLRKAADAGFDRHVAKPPAPGEIERLLA